MLSNTTKSTTKTLALTRRREKRTRPINQIRDLERLETIEDGCFLTPGVITVKKINKSR